MVQRRMYGPRRWLLTALALAMLLGSGSATMAQYRYGGSGGSYSSSEEAGVYLMIEGMLANPRNTDGVVAITETLVGTTEILPDWSDDPAARLAIGYRWDNGATVYGSFWGFTAEQEAAGAGPAAGRTHFTVGSPINAGSVSSPRYINTGTPGSWDFLTEISAFTADAGGGQQHQITDEFSLEWSLTMRYAAYEETMDGVYGGADFPLGQLSVQANKINEATMIGARAGLRAAYRFAESWSVGAKLGFSFLDGEVKSEARRISAAGTSQAIRTDDGRSGSISDFDVTINWHSPANKYRVWLGWEQSQWDNIAADLVINFPGTEVPVRERDSVSISGYKIGFQVVF